MNDEERYLFDLQGYLHLEGVLDAETLARMNAWIDAQADEGPEWKAQTGNAHVEHPITWGPDFLALLDHPRTLPILREIMGEYCRLDHDYAIFLQPGHGGLQLHGPKMREPYDPLHFYHYVDGKIFCGLCVATFALTDVPEGSGGLAVIPGSHKSNFPVPEEIRLLKRPSPIVRQVPTRAGDCVIFTERLIHGTLPWRGPGIRRTLFLKYAPGSLSWDNRAYAPQAEVPAIRAIEAQLSAEQRRLLMPPSADDHRRRPPAPR
ncbi:MAG TPA: phytanoyl-CoA dioxygenase family protein [Chthonomonadaceae bacterium]|nr:phytanoyl-CoA dioxygenase family protein [Chthonomonadaceae bacterium]